MMVYSDQIVISHPDVENYGYTTEEALEVWLELGWSVVPPPGEEEPVPSFVVSVGADGEETMVPSDDSEEASEEETPLPDEKESDQDDTADPEEF